MQLQFRYFCAQYHRSMNSQRKDAGINVWLPIIAAALVAIYFGWSKWTTANRLEKEEKLIFAGNQIKAAIGRYYENSPATYRQFPMRLQDLLSDSRVVPHGRYISELLPDPISGDAWGVIKNSAGEITGVHSMSADEPIKVSNFPVGNERFAEKTALSDWIFQYEPQPRRDPIALAPQAPDAVAQTAIEKSPELVANAAQERPQVDEVSVATPKHIERALPNILAAQLPLQIDPSTVQLGSGVPGIPTLASETNHERRVCIVDATRYATTCAHEPANSVSQESLRSCLIEAQSRYNQCIGI